MNESLKRFLEKYDAGEFDTGEQITDALYMIQQSEDLDEVDSGLVKTLKYLVTIGVL